MKNLSTALLIASLAYSGISLATPFTSTSPSGIDVTTVGASTVGGIVADLEGTNGTHLISQLPASSLFNGFASTNPQPIGTQTGFTNSDISLLGGGLTSASFRFTLYDGDTAAGNFDFNDNTLLVNGFNFGNWSTVNAQETDSLGNVGSNGFSGGGFRNKILDTGWFTSTNTTLLNSIFTSLSSTLTLTYALDDVDPIDNFYDFTQGVDNSLINVGQGPTTVTGNTVPEPTPIILLGLALAGLSFSKNKKTVK